MTTGKSVVTGRHRGLGFWLQALLGLIPISWWADYSHHASLAFIAAGLAIVPLAGLIGRSTDQIALRSGPRRGGLLNATFGNLTELIVSITLVIAGQFEIVKASLIGAMLGNLLLVLGLSFLIGGIKRKEQEFNPQAAGVHSASLLIAVTGLAVPALFLATAGSSSAFAREAISGTVAAILIVLYIAALIFTQVTHAHLLGVAVADESPRWSVRRAAALLCLAAVLVGVQSEIFVGSLGPTVASFHLSKIFVGLILIPIIGNAAENSSAIFFAIRNRLDVTLEIAVGSSNQIALFLAPALVFISLVVGHPMDFIFTPFEIITVGLATVIVSVISLDGRTNWLEGAQLVGAYLIIAVAAFFL
ncbi:MAG TPA: calcium/proton exchanger [Candidatus Dormibacteraeota bacterium]|jgi:Ca2+:H+ antiporter|nr:calcium/proton exchanger [Candidatus Dormibacteraeota bacterium]